MGRKLTAWIEIISSRQQGTNGGLTTILKLASKNQPFHPTAQNRTPQSLKRDWLSRLHSQALARGKNLTRAMLRSSVDVKLRQDNGRMSSMHHFLPIACRKSEWM